MNAITLRPTAALARAAAVLLTLDLLALATIGAIHEAAEIITRSHGFDAVEKAIADEPLQSCPA